MRLAFASLFALLLYALPALAAPAPFTRPTPEPTPDGLMAQLKQHLLREHNAYADHASRSENDREWLVVGNAPVVAGNGQVIYEQRLYRVTVSAADRRGNVSFESSVLIHQPRMVITR